MDLKEFYFNNIQEEEYHYRFYDSIKDVIQRMESLSRLITLRFVLIIFLMI